MLKIRKHRNDCEPMVKGQTFQRALRRHLRRTLACLLIVMLASVAIAGTRGYRVRVVSPQPEEVLPGPDVMVWIEAEGLDVRPGCNSVHVMIDNEPFAVKYDLSKPHCLHDVAPGTHTLRVYAANPYHEIIPGTLCVVPFAVEYHDEENRPARGEPLLTYVLPQGEYRGIDCGDILVNFAVSGAPLSRRGYRVQYYVDGRRFILYRQESAHLRDLAPGYHRIRMELVDEKERVVPGPFNVVERTILLSPEKELEPPEKGPIARLSSIQGPMTSGRLWVKRPASEPAEEVPPDRTDKQPSITMKADKQHGAAGKGEHGRSGKSPDIAQELALPQPVDQSAPAQSTVPAKETEEHEASTSSPSQEIREETGKREPETTPIVRARRVSLDQLAKTAQSQTTVTRTTLKAVSVGTTHTEYLRKVETPMTPSSDRLTTRAQILETGSASRERVSSSRTNVPLSPAEGRAKTPTEGKPNLSSPAGMVESLSTKESTQARVLRSDSLVSHQEKTADVAMEEQNDQTTAAISRVIGATGALVVVETEKR